MNNTAECYELTLTPNYVSDWTLNDAVRELIQNGTDQEVLDPSNKFDITYNSSNKSLKLTNSKSKLGVNTLLLGRSSKSNNEETVGQFGEGYKIAALVLNRLGKVLTIYNNEKNEIWESRFKNSEKWKEKILAFYVLKNETKDSGLVIEIKNVNWKEYSDLQEIWLGFWEYEKIKTTYGEILTDEDQENLIYVNGLRIGFNGDLKYGYNFKPKYIKLERDRKTCDGWEAKITTSKMLTEAMINGDIEPEKIRKMIEEDSDDIYQMDMIGDRDKIKEMLIDAFDKQNEKPLSVPVHTQDEVAKVRALGGNPVVVSHRVSVLIKSETEKRIQELINFPKSTAMTIRERFDLWFISYQDKLPSNARLEIRELINKLEI
jgi:hypothetical protein